jgi:hypothetical protein
MNKPVYIFILLVLLLSGCQKNKRYLVVSKIKSTAKLATTETIIDKVVVGQKKKTVFGLVKLGNAEFVAYSHATVKTGIDLTRLKHNDIKINGNVIELNLPPVEVIDFSYPFNSYVIDTVLSDNDLFNKIDVIDQEYYFRQAELDIRKQLKYMGIVEQTQENTRKLLTGLLTNLGYKEIYITFADTAAFIQQVNIENIKK